MKTTNNFRLHGKEKTLYYGHQVAHFQTMTLTEVVFWTKRIGLVTIIAILAFIPLRLIFMIIASTSVTRPRAELPYASQGYGALPDISLTGLALPATASPTFQLETAAGEFPEIPPVVNVYKVSQKQQSLNTLDIAKSVAKKYEFKSEPSRIPNSSRYVWQDTAGRTFTYNLATQNYSLKTDYTKDHFKKEEIVPDLNTSKKLAEKHFKGLNLLDESYLNGSAEAVYLKLGSNGEYLVADSQSDADFVRIDFFRYNQLVRLTEDEIALLTSYQEEEIKLDPDDVPEPIYTTIKTQDIIKSNIYIIIRGSNLSTVGHIYEVGYTFWGIDEKASETYYTRSPAEAWEDVKNGRAYLRSLVSKEGEPYKEYIPMDVSQFLVYDISMVFLETEEYQEYLQPIYMIRGEARSKGNSGKPDLDFIFLTPGIKMY